ncbi:hypothetical protein C9374_005071 [Naegleria lovaniensis]|uniref:Uncharacterized protein n=1 Tax=Naegleria lovaniensis TaxID=51637 RepID=A0AA88KNE8_NAELO|nr:uncharacterized protein C9374_005071 [Naegleria lovaniensis]KAG2382491.1 hypothetical protein C9374_005071 [Naegleria lovaniensis]
MKSSLFSYNAMRECTLLSPYISEEAKNNLQKYKPSTQQDYSFISKILNPYWNYVSSLIPNYVAPNTITLVGFIAVVVSYVMTVTAITLNWNHKKSGEITNEQDALPSYMYLINAVTLFWYQTMDAIDGKQARRTGTSSPLGELFDHGCDSINSLMQTVLALAPLQLLNASEDPWISFVTLVCVTWMFFISIWQQFYTSVLSFQNFSGPTEGQFVVIFVNILAFIFGPRLFNENMFSLIFNDVFRASIDVTSSPTLFALTHYQWLKLKYLVITGIVLSTVPSIFGIIYSTIKTLNESKDVEKAENEIRKDVKTPVWKSLFSYGFFSVLFLVWMGFSTIYSYKESLLQSHLLLILYIYGMYHAYIVTRFILARVCDLGIPMFMNILYILVLAFGNSLLAGFDGKDTLLDESLFLIALAAIITISYVHMACNIIMSLTEHLGIYCFSVEKRNQHTNSTNSNSASMISNDHANSK